MLGTRRADGLVGRTPLATVGQSYRTAAAGGGGSLAGSKAELVGGLHDEIEHDGGMPVNLL